MKEDTNKNPPYLRSLNALEEGVLQNGYTEKFLYENSGNLFSSDSKVYDFNQVKVISMIRFQDNESPDHLAELYIIETPDGTKGTFIKRHHTAS